MSVEPLILYGLVAVLPLMLLSAGLGLAEAVILNRRLRTRPRGPELRWVCAALFGLAVLSGWMQEPVGAFMASLVAIPLVRVALHRLRLEQRDQSREFSA